MTMEIRKTKLLFGTTMVAALSFPLPALAEGENAPWENRQNPWEVIDQSGGSVNGQQELSTGSISGSALSTTIEGIKGSPQYGNMEGVVDNNEQILMDMEARISALENQGPAGDADAWVTEPPTTADSATGAASNRQTTPWDPAYESQLDSFTQIRDVQESRSVPVEVYEYNVTTGERRLVEEYTESKTIAYGETRDVYVQVTEQEVLRLDPDFTCDPNAYFCFNYPVPVKENCDITPNPTNYTTTEYFSGTKTCDQLFERRIRATAPDLSTDNVYDTETLNDTTEEVWVEVSQTGTFQGTRPVAATCIDNTTISGGTSTNETYIAVTSSFKIGTSNWKNKGIYQYINITQLPTQEKPMLRDDGYHYWAENNGGRPETICRIPAASNTVYSGSHYSGDPQ